MHPEYRKTQRKVRVVGGVAISVGVIGLIVPLLPGLTLILAGVSLLSLQSTRLRTALAVFTSKHPHLRTAAHALESRLVDFCTIMVHTVTYQNIPRRDGNSITTLVEVSPMHAGVAVLVHSACGTKDTSFMQTCAAALRARGMTVVRFDAYDGMGESGGDFSACTATAQHEDLIDVITWARSQTWWHPHVILLGHSVGGLVAGRYAAAHPDEVQELILIAPMTSGDAYVRASQARDAEELARWRTDGVRTVIHPLSGDRYGFSYTFVKDALAYDLMREAPQLTMSVQVLVGSKDTTAPEADCRQLATRIPSQPSVQVLPGLDHTPTEHAQLALLYQGILHTYNQPVTH